MRYWQANTNISLSNCEWQYEYKVLRTWTCTLTDNEYINTIKISKKLNKTYQTLFKKNLSQPTTLHMHVMLLDQGC